MSRSGAPNENGNTIGDVLDDLWVDADDIASRKFSDFLCERYTNEKIKMPFRALQNFFDRWNDNNTKFGGNEGVAEFLKIAIENPKEEGNTVAVDGGEGSNPGGEKHIEISSAPGMWHLRLARPE